MTEELSFKHFFQDGLDFSLIRLTPKFNQLKRCRNLIAWLKAFPLFGRHLTLDEMQDVILLIPQNLISGR
jgi:hypothetical protein